MIRVPSSSLLVLLLAAAACGSADRTPRTCQQDADCGSAAYCLTGVCIAGALPEARIQIVGAGAAIVSHHRVTFDGKASTDPNPQHAVTSYRWAVKPASQASCAASPATGGDAALTTVFQCAGDYEVQLTVKNSLGLESAPVAQAISVGRSTNPPVVASRTPDLVFDHRCAGAPLVCQPVTELGDGRFALFVTASDVESGDALAYEWQVDAPPGADRGAVTFEPDRFSRTPTVRLASGGAIAGDWTFRVLATDSDGLTTPAQVKVTIGNQAPTLSSDVQRVAFPHQYADHVYRAHGTVKVLFTDPDGDPVPPPTVKLVESVPTDCVFAVPAITALPDGAYEATAELTCARPEQLIGAVERHLDIGLADANGAPAALSLPFVVLDTPPGLAAAVVTTSHGVQTCPVQAGQCFTASATAPVLVDPDGDPVRLVALAPVGLDQGIWSADAASGAFTVQTSISVPGAFRRADGTSPIAVKATVADPWTSADSTFALSIPNHAPIPSVLGAASPALAYAGGQYLAQGAVATFVDEDGDPILGVDGSGDAACSSFAVVAGVVQATCTRAFDWRSGAYPNLNGFASTALAVRVSVSDPWERSAAVAATVRPVAPPAPVVTGSGFDASTACTCRCVAGAPEVSAPCMTVNYQPRVESAGLPVNVTASAGTATAAFNCLGGQCTGGLTVNACQNGTPVTVTVSNGAATSVPALVTVAPSCTNDPCVGVRCTPTGGGGGGCIGSNCPVPP